MQNTLLPTKRLGLLISFICLLFCSSLHSQTPVAVHGQLSIDGNRLKDQNGDNYQLRGMSLYWSNWQGKFWNYNALKWLRDDWNINVIRAAMGVTPQGAYLDNPELEMLKMETVIEAAIDLGIYVVVDWHSHHAENEEAEAKAFFAKIAEKYGSYPNIIYETYNEPEADWATIKKYHEAVIPEIRKYDQNNVIVLGTPFYSQHIDIATNEPITGDNLSYSFHYYAASHFFYDEVDKVAEKGYYLFVTEFGTCESSGKGETNVESTNTWWDRLDKYDVSWCNWAVSDVVESASVLYKGASINGNWTEEDLTVPGKLIRDKLRSYPKDPVPTNIAPFITANPQSLSIPVNTQAIFLAEAAGEGLSYTWYFNGNEIAGETSDTYTIPSVNDTHVGEYHAVITNSLGTVTTKKASLEVRYRSTFHADPISLPGKLQFEDYDNDGQNIGYFDSGIGNSGGDYRNDAVDIEQLKNSPGEYAVGYTDIDEWLSYTVDVQWGGDYEVDIFFASFPGEGIMSIEVDGVKQAENIDIPESGGWFIYAKVTVPLTLTEGEHIIKFNIENPGFNLDYAEFRSLNDPEIAPVIITEPKNTATRLGKPAFIYATVAGAKPMEYTWYHNGAVVNGATESTLHIESAVDDDAGEYYVVATNSLGTVTSQTVTLEVLNSPAYGGYPTELPGRILCKNFDEGGNGSGYSDLTSGNEAIINTGDEKHFYREEDVDTEACSDGGTGHSVGYIDANEWLQYSVVVKHSGTYKVGIRVAAGGDGVPTLSMEVDGVPKLTTVGVPNTGGWATWETIEETLELTEGGHVIRIKANQGGFNLNYVDFSLDMPVETITLQHGWNLVAFGVAPSPADPETVFNGISDIKVKTFDEFFNSEQESHLNSLSVLSNEKGYYVYNGNAEIQLSLTGTESTYTPDFTTLAEGWHLISTGINTIDTGTLPAEVKIVKNFNSFWQKGNEFSSLKTLEANSAYLLLIEKQ